MARQKSYGEILRDARERKRMSISDVSKRLRIRPDILHSIETSDFTHMPPRGYTRNMINAYANLVGLDPREITELYLDEAYRYESGSPRKGYSGNSSASSQRFSRNAENGSQRRMNRFSRSNSASQRNSQSNFSSRSSQSTGRIQRTNSSDASFARRTNRMRNSQQRQDQRDTTNANSLPRLYSAPSNTRSITSFITPQFLLVVALVVVIIILIISIAVAFGGSRESSEDVPNVPISGLTDTSGNSALEETPTTTEAAPTEATIVYEVVEDESAWIEITSDDATDFSFEGEVAGAYTSDPISTTGQVIFKTTDPDSVILKVNGEVVELVSDGTDYYTYTVDFPTILAAWQAAHGLTSTEGSDAENDTAQEDVDSSENNVDNGEDSSGSEDYSYDYDDDDDYSYSYNSSNYDYDDDDDDSYSYNSSNYDYDDDDDDYSYDYDNYDYDEDYDNDEDYDYEDYGYDENDNDEEE